MKQKTGFVEWWKYYKVVERKNTTNSWEDRVYYVLTNLRTGREEGKSWSKEDLVAKAKISSLELFRTEVTDLNEPQCRKILPRVSVKCRNVLYECGIADGFTRKAILTIDNSFFAEVTWEQVVHHVKDRRSPILVLARERPDYI